MSAEEQYNGWTNRETWAVALHINNDHGWQEDVHEAIREKLAQEGDDYAFGEVTDSLRASWAGDVVAQSVDAALDITECGDDFSYAAYVLGVLSDIGSLWRVNWTELGASFLEDISAEGDGDELTMTNRLRVTMRLRL